MKKVQMLTAIILLSFALVNVQGAVERTYLVREDFNDLTGWGMTPNANFTVDNGELMMGNANRDKGNNFFSDAMWKNTTVEKFPDNINIKLNIRGHTLGEPDWASSSYTGTTTNSAITVSFRNGSKSIIYVLLKLYFYDTNTDTDLTQAYAYVYVGGYGINTFSDTIFRENDIPHGTEKSTSIELNLKKVSPTTWRGTLYEYYEYNFTGEKTPKEIILPTIGEEITSINLSASVWNYGGTKPVLEKVAFSDLVYVTTESYEQVGEEKTITTEDIMFYLIPVIILGVGIFTAITGNPKYKYLILVSFALFGIFAIVDAQYFLSAIAFISTGAYGYMIRKGGGFFE